MHLRLQLRPVNHLSRSLEMALLASGAVTVLTLTTAWSWMLLPTLGDPVGFMRCVIWLVFLAMVVGMVQEQGRKTLPPRKLLAHAQVPALGTTLRRTRRVAVRVSAQPVEEMHDEKN